jgi:ribonuclease H2 subunit A
MDSKVLTKERRTQLYNEIENDQNLAFLYDETSARFISGCMLAKERISLNSIAMESTCRLIQQAVQTGLNLIHVYVDTVGKPEKHKQELENVFPGIKFTVCPKADALYPIVSIASIVAKVSRDEALISVAEGVNDSGYGSGYPGDPETKAWLVNNVDNVFG